MKTRKNRLHDYSIFAAAMLVGVSDSSSQVIYTDIEPDIEFDFGFKNLDLDANGATDFKVTKYSLASLNTSDIICYSTHVFGVDRITLGNSILGIDLIYTNDLITPLNYGEVIANDGQFNSDMWQFLTFKRREMTCVSFYLPDSPWFYPNIGSWHTNEGEDKYIGVKFRGDTPDCYYYGWIRCVISDSLEKMTIKDYAYNANCGDGLLAGTLTSDIDTFNHEEPIITVQNDAISTTIEENAVGAKMLITSITGQVVNHSTLTASETIISTTNFSAGIYLVSINIAGQVYVKKIVIQ